MSGKPKRNSRPHASGKPKERVESDSLGSVLVPADAYWGASTQRAIGNFAISGLRLPSEFISCLAAIKGVAASVNHQLGLLGKKEARAIERAAREVQDGAYQDQFVVDVFQTGSGTSTNMNMNEVLARRAREILGVDPDDKNAIHPNDHVNCSQSSNDVIPSAMHLSALLGIEHNLLPSLLHLEKILKAKSSQFSRVVKTGRTHLQDATPITLGQEFGAYAKQIAEARRGLRASSKALSFLTVGGTAVGTGINADPRFGDLVCSGLAERFSLDLRRTKNHFRAQSTLDDVLSTSGALRVASAAMRKIADDIRWMGSGPRAGLGELELPSVQPGSSIMPGKVNPVIAESLRMVCAQVHGNDSTIAMAAQCDNFELSVMLPVVAYNLLQSIELLSRSAVNFADKCVAGIEATGKGPALVESGLGLATALVPSLGYDRAAEIAREASKSGETVLEVSKRLTGISEEELLIMLDPFALTSNTRRKSDLGKKR